MELLTLLQHIPDYTIARGDGSVDIRGVAYDSREVRPGDLFVCWKGLQHDGHRFVDDAVRRGAVAVIAEREVAGDIPVVIVPDGRTALAHASAAFYGFPSRRLRVIGVTGTNGKTTTTYLIKALLEQAGHKVGLIGTIRHLIGTEIVQSHRTTPESLDLQRLLFQMAEREMEYVIMEVSSHALALHRVDATEFDVAVFTNLSQDHLDFHGTMEQYLQAKIRLFELLSAHGTKPNKAAIINVDDETAPTLRKHIREPVIGYGIVVGEEEGGSNVSVRARHVRVRPEGVTYDAETPAGAMQLRLGLTGRFNVYNSLAAVAVASHEGVALPFVRTALEGIPGVPGRLERIDRGQDFTVLVDYAHTPDGLQNVLETCRGFTAGRIIIVFGCGGDRDKEKRPVMGEIAARMADVVILTADNPRSEKAETICNDIERGVARVDDGARHETIVERRDAIRRAVDIARPGDVVVIAGKGHETTQVYADRTIHFDDREAAARALKGRFGNVSPDS